MPTTKWTLDKIKEEAKKYKTKGKFQKGSPAAYSAGRRRFKENWPEITAHMEELWWEGKGVYDKESKICRTCTTEKLISEFYKKSDGRIYLDCKDCFNADQKKRREERKKRNPEDIVSKKEKLCNRCKKTLPIESFNKCISNADGLSSHCKTCKAENFQERMKDPKEREEHNRRTEISRKKRPEVGNARIKRLRAKHPERYKAYKRKQRENPESLIKERAATNRRRARKLNASPPWADQKAIEMVYRDAKLLSEETGEAHHVDHIDPLQHELVCGLHIAENLCPIRAKNNCAKHNNFVPYRTDSEGTSYI